MNAQELQIEVALLEMRRCLALIEHYNQCAARESAMGHWLSGWSDAVRQAETEFNEAKASLLAATQT